MLERLGQNRHNGNKTGNRGFILVDILIGITIITIALVALATAYRQSTVAMIDIRHRTEALAIVGQQLDSYKHFDGVQSTTTPVYYAGTYGVETPITGTPYSITVMQGTPVQNSVNTKAYTVPVTVRVSWTEAQGGARNLQVTEYLYYYTP